MLQRHLLPWVAELDEVDYRVRLNQDVSKSANRRFDEGPTNDSRVDRALRQVADSRLLAAGLKIVEGMHVLDVCAGRGHLGELVITKYRARVTFADLSLSQLSELVHRLRGNSIRVTACVADLSCLPYPDGAFDAVIGNSFLHHLPDVPGAIREMNRVLRPGGQVALLHEPNVNANFWESFPISLFKNTDPVEGFADLWMFSPDDLRRLLAHGGFANVEVRATGLLSTVLINWYLILLHRFVPRWFGAIAAGYRLRLKMNEIEMQWPQNHRACRAPSLIVTAVKPADGETA